VALMLQRDPALTPENARAILQQTAQPAGGAVPNNDFGAGRVRALQALQNTPDPLDCVTTLPNGLKVRCDLVAEQPFALMAYPTPAAGSLRLRFTSPTRGRVHLALYDLLGRRVRTLIDGVVDAGDLTRVWDGVDEGGRTMPSGVYFAKLVTPGATRSIRFVLAR
jgi:flagellar hook capping protein FlgD